MYFVHVSPQSTPQLRRCKIAASRTRIGVPSAPPSHHQDVLNITSMIDGCRFGQEIRSGGGATTRPPYWDTRGAPMSDRGLSSNTTRSAELPSSRARSTMTLYRDQVRCVSMSQAMIICPSGVPVNLPGNCPGPFSLEGDPGTASGGLAYWIPAANVSAFGHPETDRGSRADSGVTRGGAHCGEQPSGPKGTSGTIGSDSGAHVPYALRSGGPPAAPPDHIIHRLSLQIRPVCIHLVA